MVRLARSGLALAAAAGLAPAWANDPDGHGPDAWRVTGVAAGDVLNARMGPGIDYAVIASFKPGEGGLKQITCVPFVPTPVWMDMGEAERQALPQRWCLVRSADRQRAGWVAQRHISEDTGAAAPPPATTPAPEDDTAGCWGMATSRAEKLPPLLQQVVDAFTLAPGFSEAPAVADDAPDYYDRARFPHLGASAFWPDSRLDAVTRALLEFDHAEGVLPHARYRITDHVKRHADRCNSTPRAYVEVTRFNLGLARHEDAIQYVNKAHGPPRDHFATNRPHVSRRDGMSTSIQQEGRREPGHDEAARADCLGQPRLALADAQDPGGPWHSVAGSKRAKAASPIYNEPGYGWAPGPARVAELLYTQATGASDYTEASESTSFEEPDLTFAISRDIRGQDSNTQGLLRWQGLMDDALAEIWLRLRALPDGALQWQERTTYHPGRH